MVQYTTQQRQIVASYAQWLEQEKWSAFCTFTTYYRLNITKARLLMDQLFDNLAKEKNLNPVMFWVAEPFESKYDYHIHSLIKINEIITPVDALIRSCWHEVAAPAGYRRHNLAQIKEYDPNGGAHWYIAKYLNKQNIEYDVRF